MVPRWCMFYVVLQFVVVFGCGRRTPTPDQDKERPQQPKLTGKFSVRDNWIVDQHGRVRIFHGFNNVVKTPPYLFDPNLLNVTRLKLYKEWGFNALRLGTMWAGAQPEGPETFNQKFFSGLGDTLKALDEHGIYALLDMHQDVLSSKYHAYDGVPLWVINSFPPARLPFPQPLPNVTFWADGYFTDAVGHGFQCLYDNYAGALDHMGAYWQKVASFAKNFSNVLGYELINEPWAGDIYQYPTLLLPAVAGYENLMPMYDKLVPRIRQIDADTLIFYEPVTWAVELRGVFGTGFTHVPGGWAARNKSVLSYHYYCWGSIDPKTKTRTICDNILGQLVFAAINTDVSFTGGSSFLTEFGMCEFNTGSNPNKDTVECEFVMRQADINFQSWTYWDSDFFDGTGHVNIKTAMAFSRVYPRAVAGIPQNINYDPGTHTFVLYYELDETIDAPTEIFIPPLHFPYGFHVKLSHPQLTWQWDANNYVLSVMKKKNLVWFNTRVVSVEIQKKNH